MDMDQLKQLHEFFNESSGAHRDKSQPRSTTAPCLLEGALHGQGDIVAVFDKSFATVALRAIKHIVCCLDNPHFIDQQLDTKAAIADFPKATAIAEGLVTVNLVAYAHGKA